MARMNMLEHADATEIAGQFNIKKTNAYHITPVVALRRQNVTLLHYDQVTLMRDAPDYG